MMADPFDHPDNPIRILEDGYILGGDRVETRTVRCGNGWNASYSEYGDPDGVPVLYLHGWPGSRYEAGLVSPGLKGLNVRLIAVDRPGFGLSTEYSDRTLMETCRLLAGFTKALELNRFRILAVSGGCPFALGLASIAGESVEAISVVGGLGPTAEPALVRKMMTSNQFLLGVARWTPWATWPMLNAWRSMIPFARPDHFPKLVKPVFPESDFYVLSRPEIYFGLNLVMREAFRQSASGVYHDGRIFGKGWSLPSLPSGLPVHFWHGLADVVVPSAMSEFMAAHVENSRLSLFPSDGHFSLPIGYCDQILSDLISS